MINLLIKLGNELDKLGHYKESNEVDHLITKQNEDWLYVSSGKKVAQLEMETAHEDSAGIAWKMIDPDKATSLNPMLKKNFVDERGYTVWVSENSKVPSLIPPGFYPDSAKEKTPAKPAATTDDKPTVEVGPAKVEPTRKSILDILLG